MFSSLSFQNSHILSKQVKCLRGVIVSVSDHETSDHWLVLICILLEYVCKEITDLIKQCVERDIKHPSSFYFKKKKYIYFDKVIKWR